MRFSISDLGFRIGETSCRRREGIPRQSRGLRLRGITLLEVLISMFVLLFGLMGVAAVFPVGNHYAGRGEQFDRSTALSESAFGEVRSRTVTGSDPLAAMKTILDPENWVYAADGSGTNFQPLSGTDAITNRSWQYPAATPLVMQNRRTTQSRADKLDSPGLINIGDPNVGPGRAFVIDPLGVAAGLNVVSAMDVFPFAQFNSTMADGIGNNGPLTASNTESPWGPAGVSILLENRWPIRRVTLPTPDPSGSYDFTPLPTQIAESIFRLRDDLAVELPAEADRPAIQRWRSVDLNSTRTPDNPADDTPIARAFTGNYSWLATVVPTGPAGLEALQPASKRHGNESYDVSVAVVYKRDLTPSADSERAIAAQLFVGGEVAIYATGNQNSAKAAVDNALKDVRAGQWIALAGVNPANGQFLLKWYRLLSLDAEKNVPGELESNFYIDNSATNGVYVRRAMVEGPDWPAATSNVTGVGLNNNGAIEGLQAILIPGVVDVTTQSLRIGQTPAEWGM